MEKETENNLYEKSLIKIFLYLFIFIAIYFTYNALTTNPSQINELDSLGQHIPLAQSFLQGRLFNPPSLHRGLGFYLPIGEIILSGFIKLGIPLGFYNLFPYILLFYICFLLGKKFGLDKLSSLAFSYSISSVNSLLRLVPTQKNDIWVTLFFITLIYLILTPSKKLKYFILLSIVTGLLIGVKYSGILYAFFIFIFLGRKLKFESFINILFFTFFIFVFGFIWYIRNYLITGDPFYPVSILGFRGNPEFIVPKGYQNFIGINNIKLLISAFISEYLIFAFSPIVLIILLLFKKAKSLSGEIKNILWLSIFSFSAYLLSPTEFTQINFFSNIRFTYQTFFPFILIIFILFKKLKLQNELYLFSLLNSITVFTQFNYYPKLIILWMLIVIIFEYRNNFKKHFRVYI